MLIDGSTEPFFLIPRPLRVVSAELVPAHSSASPPAVLMFELRSKGLKLAATAPTEGPLPTVSPFQVLLPPPDAVPPAQR